MSATALEWISGRDTGMSSQAIWRHMMGLNAADPQFGGGKYVPYPLDPDDFGRCYRLLCLMPEWRVRIGEMARYPVWDALAPAWDHLTALWEEEIGVGVNRRRYHGHTAPKLYAEMKRLEDGARQPTGTIRVSL